MTTDRTVMAIVTARGGSKGIPGKNIIDVAGKPLIAYTLDAARSSHLFERIHVSTDSPVIASVCEELGVGVPFLRAPELATDTASSDSVIQDVIDQWARRGYRADCIMLLQPTSPLRTAEDIRAAWEVFRRGGFKTLTSVSPMQEHPEHEFAVDEGQVARPLHPQFMGVRRQELPVHYKVNGAIYIAESSWFERHGNLYSDRHGAYVMPAARSADVDTPADLAAVRFALSDDSKAPGQGERRKFEIAGIPVGPESPPVVVAELGINHEGSLDVAKEMVDAAARAGVKVLKHQTHVIDDEMIPMAKEIIPGNAQESICEIMERCALNETEEIHLKEYVESRGMVFMSTPFSRAAALRLQRMDVPAFKIGSGECNNLPLIELIASFGKPMIVSTGMNSLESVKKTVAILERHRVDFALLHTTNLYPTPNRLVRLGGMLTMAEAFPQVVYGLSDHTVSNHACLAAVALGASVVERHFTDRTDRQGPDIVCSMDERACRELIEGTRIVWEQQGGQKGPAPEERVTIDFAFASVCTIAPVRSGAIFSEENIWVKRPGKGGIAAERYAEVLGRRARTDIAADVQLRESDIIWE